MEKVVEHSVNQVRQSMQVNRIIQWSFQGYGLGCFPSLFLICCEGPIKSCGLEGVVDVLCQLPEHIILSVE